MINSLRSKIDFKVSRSPYQTSNSDVKCAQYAHGSCFSDDLEEENGFVWAGSHLLQEVQPDGRYTDSYINPASYEPLAQVHNWTTAEGESHQQTHYFHFDQIGIPKEITDIYGNLLWYGEYTAWGRLKKR